MSIHSTQVHNNAGAILILMPNTNEITSQHIAKINQRSLKFYGRHTGARVQPLAKCKASILVNKVYYYVYLHRSVFYLDRHVGLTCLLLYRSMSGVNIRPTINHQTALLMPVDRLTQIPLSHGCSSLCGG